MLTAQRKAFLDVIPFSELGPEIIRQSDRGYDVLVGSTPKRVILFKGYADHPRRLIQLRDKQGRLTGKSTAAGRYQILARFFDDYKVLLKLPDFSPESQDAIALQMIKEQGALGDIDAGRFARAIDKCKNIWASFPGAGYHQHENKIGDLQAAFVLAGGEVA